MATKRRKIVVYVSEPIYQATKACAASIDQSMSNYAAYAIAQRNRNWKDPVTGEPVVASVAEAQAAAPYAGFVCDSCSGRPKVQSCKHPENHLHNWVRIVANPEFDERYKYECDDNYVEEPDLWRYVAELGRWHWERRAFQWNPRWDGKHDAVRARFGDKVFDPPAADSLL